jgi:hypothetical protein
MTAGPRRDDKQQPGDALDRAIDETLGAAMRTHAVDLREPVLARLDEPAEAPVAWWRFVLRPALLPAAGAALIVVGVVLAWQHVDDTLARIGAPRPATTVARTTPHPAAAPTTKADGARGVTAPPSILPEGTRRARVASAPATAAATTAAMSPSGRPVAAASQRVAAASLPDMDATSKPAGVVADTVLMGDDAGPEPVLPGAVGGDLGDPIKPMPPLRPIVIQPIVAAPIVDAPPVSTLASPVGTIPTVGEISRDPSGPGKPGGVRQ